MGSISLRRARACGPAPPRAPTSPPSLVAPRAASAAGPPWLREVETEVATLRGLPFLREVPYAQETREDFRVYVRGELARDYGGGKGANESRALSALGFVPTGFDLPRALEDALVSEVAAFIYTRRRDFRVLDTEPARAGSDEIGDRAVVAHELTHALQDQHFGLDVFEGEHPVDLGLDDDEKLARRCVDAGEATFVMFAHAFASGRGADIALGPFAVASVRMTLAALGAADTTALLGVMRAGPGELDGETRRELETLDRLPPWVMLPLIEPYFRGAALVSEVWGRGGWPAVDRLYRSPPRSTEQVLHPTQKLLDAADAPVRIRLLAAPPPLPPGRDTRLVETNVLGELGWRIYFVTWHVAAGDRAAAGWGGDRFWVWERGRRVVTAIATTWDTEADADEFAAAYEETLASRFPRAVASGSADAIVIAQAGGPTIEVARHGRDVDVIDGANEADRASLRRALRAAERRAAPDGGP